MYANNQIGITDGGVGSPDYGCKANIALPIEKSGACKPCMWVIKNAIV
jgi:hypothetical protein